MDTKRSNNRIQYRLRILHMHHHLIPQDALRQSIQVHPVSAGAIVALLQTRRRALLFLFR